MTPKSLAEREAAAGSDLLDLLSGCTTWHSTCGSVRVVLDYEAFDFHMDANQKASVSLLKSVTVALATFGFELLDEDEHEPELLDDDFLRIYLAPTFQHEPPNNGGKVLPFTVPTLRSAA